MLEECFLRREQFPVLKEGKSISLKQVQIPPYNPNLMAQWHFSRESLQECIAAAFKDYLTDLDELQALSPHAVFYLHKYSDSEMRPKISQSGGDFICEGINGLGPIRFSKFKIELQQGISAAIPDVEIAATYIVPAGECFNRSQSELYRLDEQKKLEKSIIYASSLGWAVQGSGVILKIFLKSLILSLDNMALNFNTAAYS